MNDRIALRLAKRAAERGDPEALARHLRRVRPMEHRDIRSAAIIGDQREVARLLWRDGRTVK